MRAVNPDSRLATKATVSATAPPTSSPATSGRLSGVSRLMSVVMYSPTAGSSTVTAAIPRSRSCGGRGRGSSGTSRASSSAGESGVGGFGVWGKRYIVPSLVWWEAHLDHSTPILSSGTSEWALTCPFTCCAQFKRSRRSILVVFALPSISCANEQDSVPW